MKILRMAALLLLLAGCGRQPPPTPPSSQTASIEIPYPRANSPFPQDQPGARPRLSEVATHPACGALEGGPFAVASAVVWQDGGGVFMTLQPEVPVSNGKYDPRALSLHPCSAFILDLCLGRMQEGAWEETSDALSAQCPVTAVHLQIVDPSSHQIRTVDGKWGLALHIEKVVHRQTVETTFAGLNILGKMALDFQKPSAYLNGEFLAHDCNRESEILPEQPHVPTPTPR